ncbi:MAG: sugar phosphate isomerase/epimerase [Verrucomicrobia bacterium]|nr:sugar phosphate isomerase/epimerase [Verrucomicrobiota bacterium]
MNRRHFLKTTSAGFAAGFLGPSLAFSQSTNPPRIYKAVKWTMIKGDFSVYDKFQLSKDVGFDGISLMAPGIIDLKEVLQAQDKTGLPVHNVNDANHWKVRLSDPDSAVRKQAIQDMRDTIQFASDTGADSILLVVGKVTDPANENHDQVWERSTQAIQKTLPLAARLGVRILLENVGNGFCETPELWNEYIDQFASPWVGAFFDIGNHHSRGGADVWLRKLGTRIVKLDVKGHHSDRKKNCDLFDGDIDWAKIRQEIERINFTGWATAEVSGGDGRRLRQVVERMDRALGI